MEIGISTASLFNKMNIEDAVTELGGHGVGLTELFLNTFSEYEPAFVDVLQERLHAQEMRVYSVHPQSPQFEPQLFSIHQRQKQDAIAIYEKVLSAGERLGAKVYVMHGPATMNGAAKNMELERLAPLFRELCDRALQHGLTLALEDVSWCICCKPEFVTLLREATGDRIHFTLDIKQAVRSGHDPLQFLWAMGERLVNVHLCDMEETENHRWYWRMPGTGTFDFAAFGQALRQVGYAGPSFVEVYSDMYQGMDELYACWNYLKKCM